MDTRQWCEGLRQRSAYHQAAAMLKAIEEHQQAIQRLEDQLKSLGEFAELARLDRRQLHVAGGMIVSQSDGSMRT